MGIHLVVTFTDHSQGFFNSENGWKIDSSQRCIIIGRGLQRTIIPMDNIRYIEFDEGIDGKM